MIQIYVSKNIDQLLKFCSSRDLFFDFSQINSILFESENTNDYVEVLEALQSTTVIQAKKHCKGTDLPAAVLKAVQMKYSRSKDQALLQGEEYKIDSRNSVYSSSSMMLTINEVLQYDSKEWSKPLPKLRDVECQPVRVLKDDLGDEKKIALVDGVIAMLESPKVSARGMLFWLPEVFHSGKHFDCKSMIESSGSVAEEFKKQIPYFPVTSNALKIPLIPLWHSIGCSKGTGLMLPRKATECKSDLFFLHRDALQLYSKSDDRMKIDIKTDEECVTLIGFQTVDPQMIACCFTFDEMIDKDNLEKLSDHLNEIVIDYQKLKSAHLRSSWVSMKALSEVHKKDEILFEKIMSKYQLLCTNPSTPSLTLLKMILSASTESTTMQAAHVASSLLSVSYLSIHNRLTQNLIYNSLSTMEHLLPLPLFMNVPLIRSNKVKNLTSAILCFNSSLKNVDDYDVNHPLNVHSDPFIKHNLPEFLRKMPKKVTILDPTETLCHFDVQSLQHDDSIAGVILLVHPGLSLPSLFSSVQMLIVQDNKKTQPSSQSSSMSSNIRGFVIAQPVEKNAEDEGIFWSRINMNEQKLFPKFSEEQAIIIDQMKHGLRIMNGVPSILFENEIEVNHLDKILAQEPNQKDYFFDVLQSPFEIESSIDETFHWCAYFDDFKLVWPKIYALKELRRCMNALKVPSSHQHLNDAIFSDFVRELQVRDTIPQSSSPGVLIAFVQSCIEAGDMQSTYDALVVYRGMLLNLFKEKDCADVFESLQEEVRICTIE
eukprot:GDKJ01017671.1.p1 GENE.GDKJ01017671.1~~GDKJ01017671.1.p1  ORF type:complete len:868 (+),score=146.54 GDKJ01017671.1:299-2605(+)